ncbi:hypothetical protein [Oceanimonas smirnovii]|uniref:hypothetical protein n=1 Tax=Oceanimonas smirnovii TaxID=264574 RepID=UPI00037A6401|nr:hypothetical protein [Oceanimonas smirnovii]
MDVNTQVSNLLVANSELAGKVSALESILAVLITLIDNPSVNEGLKTVLANEEVVKQFDDPEFTMAYLQTVRSFRDVF